MLPSRGEAFAQPRGSGGFGGAPREAGGQDEPRHPGMLVPGEQRSPFHPPPKSAGITLVPPCQPVISQQLLISSTN